MASINDLPAGTWTVDASHSEIGFVARHLMVTRSAASSTSSRAPSRSATTSPTRRSTAVVQIASVDTGSADRDAHLKSGDFFDAETNPDHELHLDRGHRGPLTGDLTIKGVTKPVTFDLEFNGLATDPWGNEKAGFEATADINRKDWDLGWNVALEGGGVLVSEKIKLNLDIQLAKAA